MKTELTQIIEENTNWLDANQQASKEEYEMRSKEFQEKMKPLQEKLMSGMSMPQTQEVPPTTQENQSASNNVNIEDVD